MTSFRVSSRRQGFVVACVAGLWGLGALGAAAQPGSLPLTEAKWLSERADIVRALTVRPGECLAAPEGPEAAYRVEVGRAAFRSPLLFGGPAARGGLACDSCHRDGHDNPDFFLAGLSGAPGTADVTSSLFSKTRDDGVLNPLPIPSLVDVSEKTSFGVRAPAPILAHFVESAITDEFQGAPPPLAIVDALAAYMQHLKSEACPEGAQAADVSQDLDDVARALAAGRTAWARGDAATADFLVLAAQNRLRAPYERFAGDKLGADRDRLTALGREIGALRTRMAGAPDGTDKQFRRLAKKIEKTKKKLREREEFALYEPAVLRRALEAGETPR